MDNNEVGATAAAPESAVKKSISAEQYAVQRAEARQPKQPTEEAKAEPAKAAVEPKAEAKAETPKADAPSKDVHSQLDELTDEDIAELAQKGKSGLLKRVAELTAKRKMAEERAAQLEQQIAQQSKPAFADAKVENNPYASIEDVATLNTKHAEIREVIEWAEEVLDRNFDSAGTDVVANVDGKELTKAEVRDHLRKARKAQDKYLPAQLSELQSKESRKALKTAFDTRARQELPWLEGEETDAKKNFALMMSDPRLKKLEEAIPDLAPQMGYILAHASNSMFGRKEIPLTAAPSGGAKPNIRSTPPSNPSTSVAGSARAEDREDRGLQAASKQLEKTGSVSDFITLRTQQLSKRKQIKT